MERLIVLHQYGVKNHYLGLERYCQNIQKEIIWLELDIFRQFVLFLFGKKKIGTFYKNIKGITSILLGKNKRDDLILGIAPFSFYAIVLPLLKVNRIFLHTSWPYWDGEFVPFKSILGKYIWDTFLPRFLSGAFCVTNICKNSFIERYPKFINQTYVVHHAIEDFWFYENGIEEREYDYVFVGRMVEEKGLNNILDLARIKTSSSFLLVGDGPDIERIKKNATSNVSVLGRKSRGDLKRIYHKSKTLLLPSLTSYNWVEAFGIVIIEASSCGCNVVTTKHPGPCELATLLPNITLVNENSFNEEVLIETDKSLLLKSRLNVSEHFSIDRVASKWELGLKAYD
ncbi:glycosyltransferase family 4 protein [Pseudoalteromonas sp. CAL260-MNA-CIBAN-0059]|uniref:glycosyltransferase family 4 protein n=1 Tax=Pseudoalteromonas sp. CAL260-MNA-CIBAN-0059 TaxID=3140430 RepID=UPI003325B838